MTRDLRKYARQTNFRLFAGFVLLLFLIGIGLIYLFFGRQAAVMGVVCLLAGLSPLLLIWLILLLIGWIVKKVNDV